MSHSLPGKRILLGVTGGIVVHKTPDLVRKLIAAGLEVQVVMTDSAQRFVTPLALEVVSGKPVATSWDQRQSASGRTSPHEMGHGTDSIAPQQPTLGDSDGLAGDLLGNILASSCPVLLCPSMNDQMGQSIGASQPESTSRTASIQADGAGHRRTVARLWGRPHAGPGTNRGECSPDARQGLSGKRFLVTAGPTREYLALRAFSPISTEEWGMPSLGNFSRKEERWCAFMAQRLWFLRRGSAFPSYPQRKWRERAKPPPVGGCTGDERRGGGLDTRCALREKQEKVGPPWNWLW